MDSVFSASDKQYLPQTVISVFSRNGLQFESTASSTPIMEFTLPGTLGFINAEDTVLNFEFTYKTSGEVQNLRPMNATGLAGMIRQIDITSTDGTLIEQILDYDVLQGVLYSHDNGADKQIKAREFNMRQLTEAYCLDNENPTGFVNPSVLPSQTNNGDNITAVDNAVHSFQTQKIMLPIRLSAIIGAGGRNNNRIIPLSSIGGCNIRFLLNSCPHFSVLHSDDILEEIKLADFFYATPLGNDVNAKLIKITPGFNDLVADGTGTSASRIVIPEGLYTPTELSTAFNTALTTYGVTGAINAPAFTNWVITGGGSDYDAGTDANFFVNFCTTAQPIPATVTTNASLCTQSGGKTTNALGNIPFNKIPLKWKSPYNANPYDLLSQPFLTGTSIQMETKGLSPNVFVAGGSVIKTIKSDAMTSVFNRRATLVGTDTIYDKSLGAVIMLEMTSAFDPTTIPATAYIDDGNTIKTVVNESVQYSLNNVSLDVTVVTPPPSYISSMMSAIQSGDGLDFPINVFETLRTNVLQGEGIVQMNLPYINTKS